MPIPPRPAIQVAENRGAIVPHQLWAQLTPSQQQPLRQALIGIAQHLTASLRRPPPSKEPANEC